MNVQYEVRLQIASSNETGLSGLPEKYMTDYLEAVWEMLNWDKYSFELIAPPQWHTLPNIERDGHFPTQEDLKEYIVQTYASADGTTQYFEVHYITPYDKLGKTHRLNSLLGAEIGAFVNKMLGM